MACICIAVQITPGAVALALRELPRVRRAVVVGVGAGSGGRRTCSLFRILSQFMVLKKHLPIPRLHRPVHAEAQAELLQRFLRLVRDRHRHRVLRVLLIRQQLVYHHSFGARQQRASEVEFS